MQDINFSVPDTSTEAESSNKPTLAKGSYLAVITGLEDKVNPAKGSRTLFWSLLVNANPESIKDGWDTEARPIPMTFYTYLGKVDASGKFEPAKQKFGLFQMLSALDLENTFSLSTVLHRQVIVKIDHQPSMDDQAALLVDPTHVVERWWPTVKSVSPYKLGEVKGPVLANYAEAAEELSKGQSDTGGEF